MILENRDVEFIDGLRAAAKNDPTVYDLLALLDSALMLDNLGNAEVSDNEDERRMLQSAQLAFAFARADRVEKNNA